IEDGIWSKCTLTKIDKGITTNWEISKGYRLVKYLRP
ncbi:unnamed protein product, partial [marine sediment metagenome]